MGDITLKVKAKSSDEAPEKMLTLYFDSGSPYTFVRADKAKELGNVFKLPQPHPFRGLGDGKFSSSAIMQILVELEDIWCAHLAYIIEPEAIDTEVLVGHDFMQRFNIKLDTRKRKAIIDKESLRMAQRIRRLKKGRR